MTNDMLVNDIPADWEIMNDSHEFLVSVLLDSPAHRQLRVGQSAVFTYCDTELRGTIKQIAIKGATFR